MALSILGQSAPGATTPTDLYTVGTGVETVISSLVVCNRGGTSTTFRISVAEAGGVTANKDYLYYDTAIAANSTFIATVGITLAATDVVRIYAGNANLTFSAWGMEN